MDQDDIVDIAQSIQDRFGALIHERQCRLIPFHSETKKMGIGFWVPRDDFGEVSRSGEKIDKPWPGRQAEQHVDARTIGRQVNYNDARPFGGNRPGNSNSRHRRVSNASAQACYAKTAERCHSLEFEGPIGQLTGTSMQSRSVLMVSIAQKLQVFLGRHCRGKCCKGWNRPVHRRDCSGNRLWGASRIGVTELGQTKLYSFG